MKLFETSLKFMGRWNERTNMTVDDLRKHDFENLNLRNAIITPEGEFLSINYQSHDYYLGKLTENRRDEIKQLKKEMQQHSDFNILDRDVIITKFGYISIHSSGMGYGFVSGPKLINDKQLSIIETKNALGEIPGVLYDIIKVWNNKDKWWNKEDGYSRISLYRMFEVMRVDKEPTRYQLKFADLGYYVTVTA